MTTKAALLVTLVLAAAAYQKERGPTTPPADGDGGEPAAGEGGEEATKPGAPDVKWVDKSFDQRKESMGVEVLPAMKALFKEYDEAQFKGFNCKTCHGDGLKERNYKMPSEAIYPLPEADPVKAAMEYDENVAKFMVERVVPKMATLLDATPYDPETGQGFGCFGCHPKE